MSTSSAAGVKWNLTDLFASHDDPQIERTLQDCHHQAQEFAARYRSAFDRPEDLSAQLLHNALQQLEALYDHLGRVGSYAGLLYAADTSNTDYQDLEQKVEQRSTEIRNLLLFFELEWLKLDDAIAGKLMAEAALAPYCHFLANLRRYRPHTLSEPEEQLVNEKDNSGRNAFGRLFSETTSALSFAFERDGKQEELNLSQMLSLLHEPERDLRRRAM